MRTSLLLLALCVALCVALFVARRAHAQSPIDTCVRVSSTMGDDAPLARLVRSELARHPTHRAAEPPCATELEVERIDVAGQVYLTARVPGRVPHRVRVQNGRMDLAISELLRVVLGNDPLVLRDPRRGDWFGRAIDGLRRRAHPLWGVEISQRWARVEGNAFALPALSAFYRREVDAFQLGLRLDVAALVSARPDQAHPTWMATLLPELAWYARPRADLSPYAALGLGLQHQRFEGPVPNQPGVRGRVPATGLVAAARLGVELFRTTDTRLAAHVEAMLPAFVSDDPRQHVVDAWVPTLGLGVGVGF